MEGQIFSVDLLEVSGCCGSVFGWEDEERMIKKRGVVEERWMII